MTRSLAWASLVAALGIAGCDNNNNNGSDMAVQDMGPANHDGSVTGPIDPGQFPAGSIVFSISGEGLALAGLRPDYRP